MIDIRPKFSFFSDCAIRIVYLKGKEETFDYTQFEKYSLLNEIFLLTNVQTDLMQYNIFIRGGMTIGDVYFDDERNVVFGPALNKAYHFESKLAINARIIIDPTLRKTVENSCKEQFEIAVNTDEDGIQWIDYLSEDENLVYIGQSINGAKRIEEHVKGKDFWSYAIMFVTDNNSFDKLSIDYLEYEFIQRFKKSSYVLTNRD